MNVVRTRYLLQVHCPHTPTYAQKQSILWALKIKDFMTWNKVNKECELNGKIKGNVIGNAQR